MKISFLKNPILEYAWGSKISIAKILGHEFPCDKPQAEMWIGAHPKAPSKIFTNDKWIPLDEFIGSNPNKILGQSIAKEFSNKLPFLYKLLAADTPLSIQAHPNKLQAREGFKREDTLGIPIDAFNRNYRDDNHKPELICALTPFIVLIGFRPIDEIIKFIESPFQQTLNKEIQDLKQNPDSRGLKQFFINLMSLTEKRRKNIIENAKKEALKFSHIFEWKWVKQLYEAYPNDIGIISPLILNLMELKPEEAVFLDAGELHAYLNGTGIEIMANSDNVIRCGLTSKHIDVPELLRVLTFEHNKKTILRPEKLNQNEYIYKIPVKEFMLSKIKINNSTYTGGEKKRVEILLCLDGNAKIFNNDDVIEIQKGNSVFVPSSLGKYKITGNALIYKACARS